MALSQQLLDESSFSLDTEFYSRERAKAIKCGSHAPISNGIKILDFFLGLLAFYS